MAVKKAQETRQTMARPPGSHPKTVVESRTRRRPALLSASRKPAKANYTSAMRMGFAASRYISIITRERLIPRK